ncbi:hypothetical protein NE237_005799 [Protea cynaroides]|uniref:Actin cross-linking n=1 Tax=Protea cynaroides TaxID=273540 RepID=A0A9Q0QUJ9_9MAGN|nr:hypothetical protein NE237_005799 [Protea cynaroides]
MEFFQKGKCVILRSHLNKYLVADEDKETVRQSRSPPSSKARWTVEFVGGKNHAVRLKSCYGRYLTASEMPFLLGMTGKKVIQALPTSQFDSSVEWEPQKDGFQVKFRSWSGTYLRANGGPPPWRNSITHDIPESSNTQNWVSWHMEVVENHEDHESVSDYKSQTSNLSSGSDELAVSESNSPRSVTSFKSSSNSPFSSFMKSPKFSFSKSPIVSFRESEKDYCLLKPPKASFNKSEDNYQSGMELFSNAKAVRLRSHHDKYLLAEEDEETVLQERNGSSRSARWTVEFVEGANKIRLKSSYGKYLTASNEHFLLGMTGHKVLQTLPSKLDSSVEWEPIREGFQVRLKTRNGSFLRANGGVPPWRNSITHDTPHVASTQEWILWDVEIVEIKIDAPTRPSPVVLHQQNSEPAIPRRQQNSEPASPRRQQNSEPAIPRRQQNSEPSSPRRQRNSKPASPSHQQNSEPASPRISKKESPPKPDGRTIYYKIADEYGDVEDEDEGTSFIFKGHSVDELTQQLEEETGLEDITVCSRNILNDKLYPLRLHLPPNHSTMHVVVVPPSSKAARDLGRSGTQL